jgi:hypothetical protein
MAGAGARHRLERRRGHRAAAAQRVTTGVPGQFGLQAAHPSGSPPSAAWPARAATRAYRAAEQAIAAGGDLEAAVRDFVRAVNQLPGIKTGERDAAAAGR